MYCSEKSISIKHWMINLNYLSVTSLSSFLLLQRCSLRWIGNPAVRLVRRHLLYIAACVERNPRHEIKLEKNWHPGWDFFFTTKPPSHFPNGPAHARSSKWQWHWPGLGGLCKAHFWRSQGLVSSAPSHVCRVGWNQTCFDPLTCDIWPRYKVFMLENATTSQYHLAHLIFFFLKWP